MRRAYDVESVRVAESETIKLVSADTLMQRAARALQRTVFSILRENRGAVAGSRVVLIVGSGNNGGDALFCGALLARRGVVVNAIALSDEIHPAAARALARQGGRIRGAGSEGEVAAATSLVRAADVILDGIVGIGGRGALREPAATLARAAAASNALRVAVDIPSGVDPDTGAVADRDAVFTADVTVTFGCLKPGLVLPPGRERAGMVEVADIGIQRQLASLPSVRLLEHGDVTPYVAAPREEDHKYTHGVAGIVAGSSQYPGACHLVVGGARHSGVGMVRVFDRGDGVADAVISRFPDVVAIRGSEPPGADSRVSAWAIGPGAGTGPETAELVESLLYSDLPVVIDADALTIVARREDLRRRISDRPVPTVLTPHEGEFARLGFDLSASRVEAAKQAAAALGAIVLLKGAGTVIAGPTGAVYVDPVGPPDLATAGTGDVLSGLIAGILARDHHLPSDPLRQVAAAVYLHGLAARLAVASGRPLTAWDLVQAVPDTVAQLRNTDRNR
ncbi:MAG: NAD(P)H-hydrate dehydratase [Candidatus Nanopelagicales bacterium]|nr:NAD(P)H-hydrate dehydratase [Candidatus Nanopelagicales bacterium]MDZ4248548.1 NAD(P)H-hydrate dehydratase [Candidatus Nanopelagicales bacterium]